jgi:hypothetical protein
MYWNATEEPPGLAEWLDRQVRRAVVDYVSEGYITFNTYGPDGNSPGAPPICVEFMPTDPCDDIVVSRPLRELLFQEITDASTKTVGYSQGFRPLMLSMRDVLADALDLLDERLALPMAQDDGE